MPTPVRLILALCLALALAPACAPVAPPSAAARSPALGALPAPRGFPPTRPLPPQRPNAEIARDILDLTFRMESGRTLPVLTRFEAPVRVGMRGPVPPSAEADLARLLDRLRREAGIDIARARPGEAANLWVEFVPRAALQRTVPAAACFVVPRDESFAAFRAGRTGGAEWALLDRRTAATVFIPSDVAPQEVRDCLHEEIAQALGPLNDLYRLPDSVFNDDNFHTVLTGFDMLVLRALYSPELASGMTEAEVAARLPALLHRLNPRGGMGGVAPPVPENRAWTEAVETALGPRASPAERRAAASRAVAIAEGAGWSDPRLAFSYVTLGRAALTRELEPAVAAYRRALALYARSPATRLQEAHVAMQLAAFALSAGRPEEALALVRPQAAVAQRAENAALMATLLLIEAEALEALGRRDEARRVRLDSLGWARYGFGSEAQIAARLGEIAVLRGGGGGG
jgi:tetratricopeptide (TPR) repeat protein